VRHRPLDLDDLAAAAARYPEEISRNLGQPQRGPKPTGPRLRSSARASLRSACQCSRGKSSFGANPRLWGADSDEVAWVDRYEVARRFRDDVAHLSDLISPSDEQGGICAHGVWSQNCVDLVAQEQSKPQASDFCLRYDLVSASGLRLIFRYCPSSLTVTYPSHGWCECQGLFSENSDCRGRCRHGAGPCRTAQAVRVRRGY
jgi:hypothetical protein